MIPLFNKYPDMPGKIPHIALGQFPTPVHRLERIKRKYAVKDLYIKRDDLTGPHYGGNKVRKLEFLLAEAQERKAREVVTFGAAGSNHALATAIYTRQLGLKSISMLVPQPNAGYVRHHLLMSYHCGAELHLYRKLPLIPAKLTPSVLYHILLHGLKSGRLPCIIPMGGSSPTGALGFVNAAFELKEQIDGGAIPEPDFLYVASGSMGTAAGLILGLKAAACKAKVIAIRVNSLGVVNEKAMLNLIRRTARRLASVDKSFPPLKFSAEDFEINHDFFGSRYALFTEEGVKAIRYLSQQENISLEGAYTGKAMAALVSDLESGKLDGKTVLFWNTHNSREFSASISGIDYRSLPQAFHLFFEQQYQPLDVPSPPTDRVNVC